MSSIVSNMEECFNFESQYRSSDEIMMLNFQTADETQWTMSEEWLTAKREPKVYLQRLIFRKENHYERFYSMNIEITSANNHTSGMIKVSKLSHPVFTRFTIPLDKFKIFHYSYDSFTDEHEVQINERALTDIFRYKVTISTTNHLELSNFRLPRTDKAMVFSDHIRSLLESRNFSDIVLTDGQVHIRAHRNILSARSPVFQKMFQSNMRESRDGFVVIRDINIKIVREMLKYMYSGVLRPIDVSTALDLYKAADKYILSGLKELCCLELKRHLSAENAVDILTLASLYEEEELHEDCLEFLARNFNQMRSLIPWQLFQIRCPQLVREIEDRRQVILESAPNS